MENELLKFIMKCKHHYVCYSASSPFIIETLDILQNIMNEKGLEKSIEGFHIISNFSDDIWDKNLTKELKNILNGNNCEDFECDICGINNDNIERVLNESRVM